MKIQMISTAMGYKSFADTQKSLMRQNFSGLVTPVKHDRLIDSESQCGGEVEITTYTNLEEVLYYRFTDDSPKELSDLKQKYEYKKLLDQTSHDTGCMSQSTYEYNEGRVRVVDVPVSFEDFKRYKSGVLSFDEKEQLENSIKKAKLDFLLVKPKIQFRDALKQVMLRETSDKCDKLCREAARIMQAQNKAPSIVLKDASDIVS